jgi:hypothetical protein
MLNSTDTLIASDEVNNIDLFITADGRVYLFLDHEPPASCFLNCPLFAAMLRTIEKRRRVSLHVEPLPQIPGVAHEIPLMAFLSICDRVVLACVPTLHDSAEAEAIFDALPFLPMVVSNDEVLANRKVYDRVMSIGRN